ncbi:ABC transporter permease [Georgenia deserti]|uniref:ABC transporter permease n=1 Tax=Georgenia deserti TaxID=2093781 RepID=A0ABW4L3R9_9MICO
MSAAVATGPRAEERALAPVSWRWPIIYAVFTLVALAFLRVGDGATTFRISRAGDFFEIPDVSLPALATNLVLLAVMAAATAVAVRRALRRAPIGWWVPAAFGIAFVLAFLTWVGAGRTTLIPLTTLLAGALALSVPLVFGAMSGVICERSGVINIAIEGQLLAGAFLAAVVGSLTASAYLGMAAAPIAGALVGGLLAFFAVRYWVDQIIVGVVLNVLVVGLTSFLFSTVLTENSAVLNARQSMPDIPIPGLAYIPVIGPVLFRQSLLVYLMYAAVIAAHILLFRSRWGLRTRAVGEHPKAADTVGIKVERTRVVNTVIGGAVAGLGGAFFTVGSGLAFGREMSAGQGYIALAAMILGRWSPKGAVAAALMFGFARSLVNMLSGAGAGISSDLLLMLPYAVTILAVAGFVGRVRPPAAENVPYVK